MSLTVLLIQLRARRVHLDTRNGNVLVTPSSALTDELRAAIREHKAALLTLPRPSLNTTGDLVILLDAPPQYHWQPVAKTLRELNAPPEIWQRYVRRRRLI